MSEKIVIRFCGFGGQGIILSSIIFGTAAVEYDGKYGVQTQSYGSEARGGECKSELILANEQIYSPIADKADILVAMSQQAYNKYIGTLKSGGLLIIDSDIVTTLNDRKDIKLIKIPATKIAFEKIKSKITANMVILGFLQNFTKIVSEESLKRSVRDLVVKKFLEDDLRALNEGIEISKKLKGG